MLKNMFVCYVDVKFYVVQHVLSIDTLLPPICFWFYNRLV